MTRIVVGRGNGKAQRCLEALVKYEMMKRSNAMTDDELAEDYALENYEYYEEGQTDYKALKRAFLAALKAGRPKWHKVADSDLPPICKGCESISVKVVDEYDRIIIYDWSNERWIDCEGDHLGVQPTFWCEIPTYSEEQK